MSALQSDVGLAFPPLPSRRRVGLRMRWHLASLSCAMLLPLLSFGLIEANDVADARQAAALAQMQTLTLVNAQAVQGGLAAMRMVAQVLALSPALAAQDLAGFRRAADQVARDRGVDVVLRNPSGVQAMATRVPPDTPPPPLPQEDPEARAAVEAGRSYVSNVFTSGMTHPFLLRVVVPAVFGTSAKWAVEVAFTPEQVRGWLSGAETPQGWAVSVVGGNGLVIARSKAHDDYVGRGTAQDQRGPVSGLSGPWHGRLLDGGTATGVYLPVPGTGWIVATGAAEAALARPRMRLMLRLAAVAATLVGLGVLASALLARHIERDTAALAQAAETLAAETLAAEPLAWGPSVIGFLLPVAEFRSISRALAAAGREVAARRHNEHRLLEEVRQSRDLLRAVMDGTADPIFARDLEGRFVLVNQAGAALLGTGPAEAMIGRRVADLAPPAEVRALLHWDGAVEDQSSSADCALGLPGDLPGDFPGNLPGNPAGDIPGSAPGASRVYQVSRSPWRDRQGQAAGMVCVARDITERTAAEARLRALQQDLARAGRLSAVAAMAAGLAHELNQPLSAATNFLAAAESLMASSPLPAAPLSEAQGAMAEASAQMLRAAGIVRRLRGFIGRDEMAMAPEALAPLVAEAAQAAWHYAAAPGASLSLHLDPDAAALVDPVQLQQVVANLVRNAAEALEASADKDGSGEAWVCLSRTADGGSIVDVRDSGAGLDPLRRERLFDVFQRSGKAEDAKNGDAKNGGGKPGGMGVGLAICRTIVAAHGGHIWAEDNPGGGAVFRFTLPPLERGLDG